MMQIIVKLIISNNSMILYTIVNKNSVRKKEK